MRSFIVGILWIGAGVFVLYVLSLAMAPSASRNQGGRGGTSPFGAAVGALGRGVLEAQAIVEPQKRHVLEAQREGADEENDDGGPPPRERAS